MASQKQPALPPMPPLTQDELPEWRNVRREVLKALIAKHDGKKMAPAGTVNLAGEYADYAILEERRRFARS
jgi:hypothetical protein